MKQFLKLPHRDDKPRKNGFTVLIDNGYPLNYFKDVISSHADLIDYIKFGWGTAYITKDFEAKVAIAREHNIDMFFGGSFFEKAYFQGKLADFCQLVRDSGFEYMEVSNGSIPLENSKKAQIIKQLSGEFKIFSEVGYKDDEKSEELTSDLWIQYIQEDLAAGAVKVITEARESGSSGICSKTGELKTDLIDDILNSGIPAEQLIFEAPNKSLQVYFVKKIGPNVNLANIPFQDALALETLRLGLRGDTLIHFEKEVSYAQD